MSKFRHFPFIGRMGLCMILIGLPFEMVLKCNHSYICITPARVYERRQHVIVVTFIWWLCVEKHTRKQYNQR